jgi:hypothetical protein
MPSARAEEFRRVALKLGFLKTRCTEDKRSAPLFHRIITQVGIDTETFARF